MKIAKKPPPATGLTVFPVYHSDGTIATVAMIARALGRDAARELAKAEAKLQNATLDRRHDRGHK
jgi:hypothetical protein